MVRCAPALLAAIALLGCRDPEPKAAGVEPPPAVELAAAPVVELTGCVLDEARARTCSIRSDTRLVLWVDAPAQPELTIAGTALEHIAYEPVDDGWRVRLPPATPLGELRVSVPGSEAWTLSLDAAPQTPTVDAIFATLPVAESNPEEPMAQRAALTRLEREIAVLPGYEAIRADALASRVALALGESERALSHAEAALARALRLGYGSEVIAGAHLVYQQAPRAATESAWALELQDIYEDNDLDAGLRARSDYNRALQAIADGNLGRALDLLETSARWARELDLVRDELGAASQRLWILALLGRDAEQRETIDRIMELIEQRRTTNTCLDVAVLNNVGWSLLVARARNGVGQDVERFLERTLSEFSPTGRCDGTRTQQSHSSLVNAHLNYAIHALLVRDFELLRRRLAWFSDQETGTAYAAWVRYLQGELSLHDGAALHAIELVPTLSTIEDDPLLAWQSAVLRGRANEALGRRAEALAAYLAAEKILDLTSQSLPVDQGREGLSVGLHAGASRAIGLLLVEGRTRDAIEAARRSRGRALQPIGRAARLATLTKERRAEWASAQSRYQQIARQLHERLQAAWRLPLDERAALESSLERMRSELRDAHGDMSAVLASAPVDAPRAAHPPAGVMLLLFHPKSDGWFAFAVLDEDARSIELPTFDPSDADLGRVFLDPFDDLLESAKEVRLLTMGESVSVAFHRLQWRGRPLLEARPLAWGMDIAAPDAVTGTRRALVVSAPEERGEQGTTELARDEGQLVARGLRGAGFEVVELRGASASAASVVDGLDGDDWFHYAGHGVSAGTSGWDSALRLANETRLDVRDILALPTPPRAAILSACETAAALPGTTAGGMHLAGSFVLAGASFVIGTQAPIRDEAAAAFSAALYEHLSPELLDDGPRLFRAAVLGLPASAAWVSDYRIWVP